MPQILCHFSSEEIGFSSICDTPLLPHQIRVTTHLARIRHGCDLSLPKTAGKETFPHLFRSWGVAEIIEVGESVNRFSPGDRVYGPMYHADRQVIDADSVLPVQNFSNRIEFSTFIDAGIAALQGIHASGLRFGDRIAIWGMGTVGLMALQYALMSGAREIIAVDPVDSRRNVAQKLGAHEIVSSWDDTLPPVDVALDFSGSSLALHQSFKAVRQRGTVIAGADDYSFDTNDSLCVEFREREISFLSIKEKPLSYDLQDRVQYSIVTKRVVVWPIISHLISFTQIPALIPQIKKNLNDYIQVLVTYDSTS